MREVHEATIAEILVDDELWPRLLASIRNARRRIDLTQLLFEDDFRPERERLADELDRASARGVRVRILLNENAAIPDSYDEIRERFAGTPVEVRACAMTPNVLHVKLLVADEDAFLLDAPFEQKYADTRAHAFDAALREHRLPFHAVSLRTRGPIVARLAQLFDGLWMPGVPTSDATSHPPTSPSRHALELTSTSPEGVWTPAPEEDILASYLDAFARARELIYLETQYFTSPRIAEALAEALAREPRLEVILLANEHMDVPTYDAWQAHRLADLGHPEHPRLGVFSLWAPRRLASDPAIRATYVHSKIAIVDDRWATIGSANLDSISLHDADEFGVRAPRNIELNVASRDPAFAARLRRRLWSEHLGDAGVWSEAPPPGGWLAHWRRIGEANLARVQAGEPMRMVGRVLPLGAIAPRRIDGVARSS